MNNEILKSTIIGFSIMISVLIYTERTKYEFIKGNEKDSENVGILFHVINKSNGGVRTYIIDNESTFMFKTEFEGKSIIQNIPNIIEKD